jgi:hypothetical protein
MKLLGIATRIVLVVCAIGLAVLYVIWWIQTMAGLLEQGDTLTKVIGGFFGLAIGISSLSLPGVVILIVLRVRERRKPGAESKS